MRHLRLIALACCIPTLSLFGMDANDASLLNTLSISWNQDSFRGLDERAASTPLMNLPFYPADPAAGWDLDWEQDFILVGVGMDATPVEGLTLGVRLLAGQSHGHFSAYNMEFDTVEDWETHWDDAWGFALSADVDPGGRGGAVLLADWLTLHGAAIEDEEYLTGPNRQPGPEPNNDVSFEWKDQTLSAALGWRATRLTTSLGVRRQVLRLGKTIATHYPAGRHWLHDLLNSEPARYRYEHDTVTPIVTLDLRLSDHATARLEAALSDNPSLDAELIIRF